MDGKKCTTCNSPAEDWCSRCKSASYCSEKCQKKDWTVHKVLCKEYATFVADNPRPSPTHKLCFFFPEDLAKPRLVWLNEPTSNENIFSYIKRRSRNITSRGVMLFQHHTENRQLLWPLGHDLIAHHWDEYTQEDYPNNAVYSLIGRQYGEKVFTSFGDMVFGGQRNEFRGPFLVESAIDTEESYAHIDVTMKDLSNVVLAFKDL